jgi:hypothetical protein
MFLEHGAHGLEKEIGRQIHDREIFVVESTDGLGLFGLALGEMTVKIAVGVHMPFQVHVHERGELHETGIDAPQGAGETQRHA